MVFNATFNNISVISSSLVPHSNAPGANQVKPHQLQLICIQCLKIILHLFF